jgi:hypothetical protein
MNLATERGELAGNCGLGWTIIKRRKPDWRLAEADRLGLEVQHGGGDAIDRLLGRLYATPPGVIERVRAITE